MGVSSLAKELLLDILQLRLQWHPTLVELSGLTDFRTYGIQFGYSLLEK